LRGGTKWAWFGEWASIRAAIVTVMAEFLAVRETKHHPSRGCWNRMLLRRILRVRPGHLIPAKKPHAACPAA
jgi:hypothetical protein